MAFTGLAKPANKVRSVSFVLVDGELKAELEEAYRYIDEDEKQTKSPSPASLKVPDTQGLAEHCLTLGRELGPAAPQHSASSLSRLSELDLTDLAMSDTAKEVFRALQRKEIKAGTVIQADQQKRKRMHFLAEVRELERIYAGICDIHCSLCSLQLEEAARLALAEDNICAERGRLYSLTGSAKVGSWTSIGSSNASDEQKHCEQHTRAEERDEVEYVRRLIEDKEFQLFEAQARYEAQREQLQQQLLQQQDLLVRVYQRLKDKMQSVEGHNGTQPQSTHSSPVPISPPAPLTRTSSPATTTPASSTPASPTRLSSGYDAIPRLASFGHASSPTSPRSPLRGGPNPLPSIRLDLDPPKAPNNNHQSNRTVDLVSNNRNDNSGPDSAISHNHALVSNGHDPQRQLDLDLVIERVDRAVDPVIDRVGDLVARLAEAEARKNQLLRERHLTKDLARCHLALSQVAGGSQDWLDGGGSGTTERDDRSSPGGLVLFRESQMSTQARPLTRYLPFRDGQVIDLRQFVESSGHDLAACASDLVVTTTTARGFLVKRGGRIRTWRRRHFVFDRVARTLSYYVDGHIETRRPKGVISFDDIEDVFVDHVGGAGGGSPDPRLTFCVKTRVRTYYIVAPNDAARRIWVDVIFTGAEGHQEFDLCFA